MTTGEINPEYVQWGLVLMAPILAFFTAKGIFNAVSLSRQKERRHEQDLCRDMEYRHWWGAVEAHRGIHGVFCPLPLRVGETCYMYSPQVQVFHPNQPTDDLEGVRDGDGDTDFDAELGVSVGPDWSVMDWFPSAGLSAVSNLCVTDRCVYVRGGGMNLRIDLSDIHHVSASCSSLLIAYVGQEVPLLLGSLNGQVVRDVLHLLVKGDGELPSRG